MIDVTFGFNLFLCWLGREIWPSDYLDFLSQINADKEYF
jgi:hypothetical protein